MKRCVLLNETYMVEDIYGEMNSIQHDMWICRNSLRKYDFTDIGRKLNLNDVLTWRYYYDGGLETFSVNKTLNQEKKIFILEVIANMIRL